MLTLWWERSKYSSSLFLSYVIQNFYSVNQAMILNQKSHSIWVFKNTPLMVTLIIQRTNLITNIVNVRSNVAVWIHLINVFYKAGFANVFNTLTSRWTPLLGTNYPKGMHYWTYKMGIFLIDKENWQGQLKDTSDELFFNQYYTPVVVSNVSLHNKYYRTVMMRFFQLLITNWQYWPRTYNIAFQFLLVNKNFHLVKYYNFYFFKMYNL